MSRSYPSFLIAGFLQRRKHWESAFRGPNPVNAIGTPRVPDFFCIGAEKAGTSWLWNCLMSHPDVGVPATKELRYFNGKTKIDYSHFRALKQLLEDPHGSPDTAIFRERVANELRLIYGQERAYLNIFGQHDTAVVGELSPQYCSLPRQKIVEIHQLAPNARIIYMLRDPVDRAISGVRMAHRRRSVPLSDKMLVSAATSGTQFKFSNAPEHISNYEEIFGADKVKVFFFDDIKTRPQGLLDDICDFLGAPRAAIPEEVTSQKVNAAPEQYTVSQQARQAIAAKMAPFYDKLAVRFPEEVAVWRANNDAA